MESGKKIIYDLAVKNIELINDSLDGYRLYLSESTGLIEMRKLGEPPKIIYPTERNECLVLSDELFIKDVLFKNLSARSQPLGMTVEDNILMYKRKEYLFMDIFENKGCSIFNGVTKTIKDISGAHKIQFGQRSYEPEREDIKNVVFFDSGDYFILKNLREPASEPASEPTSEPTSEPAWDRFAPCPYKMMTKGWSVDPDVKHIINPTRFEVIFNQYSQLCVVIGANVYTFESDTIHKATDDYVILRVDENENSYIVQSFKEGETYKDRLVPIYNELRINRFGKLLKWECFPYIAPDQTVKFHGLELKNTTETSWLALYTSKNGDIYSFCINGYTKIGKASLPEKLPHKEISQIPQFAIYAY